MATVALAYLFPENTLACHLESQWQSFFQSKNSPVIRTIQDRFQCCGFRSIHDRAWPFKDRDHGDNACELQLGYQRSCLGPWREQQQRVSWMVFVAAIAMLAVKVGFVYISPSRVPWMNSRSRLRVPEYQQIADAPEEGQGRDGAGNADEDRATMLPQANQGFPTHWDVD
ncbi:hypothetical protein P175DRAFT_0504954 [Aspergillus ochraceoroseus IBT 24754]|uniref:Tetraspanin Tsp3 n=3 Tax=Aspergillus subgen. Nidulantes TaxID=2720870 RepID=A0A0F8V6J7_9EURO|nr:uncharacterized protein P175DRAFT_0504954 [Aspergillus ochraceoroseus IBT 24754]KKK18718.1 hypothetical protein AOCH_002401 [Aspergillus ochraceoroseus]KKK27378.1 hypothetical protein ARAM_002284 [Aspergillus rambellii]PTU17197.1 hypothetical protein P175DRAFT_0504954 [Aspergillus ochraceoroseus IBT 24754]